jgi:hypothetical protein
MSSPSVAVWAVWRPVKGAICEVNSLRDPDACNVVKV